MITLDDAQQPFDPNASLQELAQGRSLLSDAWLRFRRNKLAMFGLVLVSLLVLVALIAPFFVNDPTVLNRIRNEPQRINTGLVWIHSDAISLRGSSTEFASHCLLVLLLLRLSR